VATFTPDDPGLVSTRPVVETVYPNPGDLAFTTGVSVALARVSFPSGSGTVTATVEGDGATPAPVTESEPGLFVATLPARSSHERVRFTAVSGEASSTDEVLLQLAQPRLVLTDDFSQDGPVGPIWTPNDRFWI